MPTFDPTITLGTALAALVIVAGTWAAASRLYSMVDNRLTLLERTLSSHAAALAAHATRMEKQDEVMARVSGDLQRVIGRMESWTDKRTT